MWSDSDIIQLEQFDVFCGWLFGEDIQASRIDFPYFQRFGQAQFVDDLSAGRVQKDHTVLHLLDSRTIDQMIGFAR